VTGDRPTNSVRRIVEVAMYRMTRVSQAVIQAARREAGCSARASKARATIGISAQQPGRCGGC